MNRGISLEEATAKLVAYCRANDWAGYDPYDALNSRVFKALPFLNARLPRLVLTQALKRSPVNIRALAGVPKTQNPKAIALFLSAFVKLAKAGIQTGDDPARLMIERLIALRSPGTPYWCWGYSFPWQTRTIVVPAAAPNLVCTTFVASALLDAYEHGGNPDCLGMAVSAAEYIVKDLYWTDGRTAAGFAYPLPSVKVQIHNANFLAAALLCRVYRHTRNSAFLEPALEAARCSAVHQREDGSWPYGEAPTQQWIDNFHTGYNLCALNAIAVNASTAEFQDCVWRGFGFYRKHFYRPDGVVNYFHDRTYPIDIHCVAQSIITPLVLRHLARENMALAESVFRWAMDTMWDRRGFFYYRLLRLGTIRTSYMRWSQAWMLLAMAMLLAESVATVEYPWDRKRRALARAS